MARSKEPEAPANILFAQLLSNLQVASIERE